MSNPFIFLNSITYDKTDLTKDEPDIIKQYNPFLINRSLSYHVDTIMLANEMNKYSFIDKDMQYKFLLYSVDKKKRFSKWAKQEESKDVKFISELYQINIRKAAQVLKLLTKEQFEELINNNKIGGTKK